MSKNLYYFTIVFAADFVIIKVYVIIIIVIAVSVAVLVAVAVAVVIIIIVIIYYITLVEYFHLSLATEISDNPLVLLISVQKIVNLVN